MVQDKTPLLNSYKQKFVKKRIPQSIFGGISFSLGEDTPWYIYFLQIVVWIFPWLIGGTFTLVKELGSVDALHAAIGTGLVIGVLVLMIQFLSLAAFRRLESSIDTSSQNITTTLSQGSSRELRRLLAEEDSIIFDSCCSLQTLIYVVSPKRHIASITIHSILSGFMCAVSFWYLLPSTLNTLYQSTGITVALYILCWIVICIAQYPLTVGKIVPETATYRSVDLLELNNVLRSFYVILILIPFIVYLTMPTVPALITVNQVTHWVFVALPLLWFFGVLPPIDCFLSYLGEQGLMFVFGGSSSATDVRCFINLILSAGVFVGAGFMPSLLSLNIYSALLGYILSTDVITLFQLALNRLVACCLRSTDKVKKLNTNKDHILTKQRNPRLKWQLLSHLIIFSLLTVTKTLLMSYQAQVTSPTLKSAMEYTFIAGLVVAKLLQDIQKVTVFGIFRNWFYPQTNYKKDEFFKKKRVLHIFGGVHIIFSSIILPLLMSSYFGLFTTDSNLPSWLTAFGVVHGFRHIWQRPGSALFNFALLSIINLALSGQDSTNWWLSAQPGTLLLILDIGRDRLFRFLDNLWFCLALLVKSWTDKKQRRSNGVLILVWNILTFPLTIAICCASAILAAPVIPLFTLPIFFISFPRPGRFWPNQPGDAKASVCADRVYYDQLSSVALNWFGKQICGGAFNNYLSFFTHPQYFITRSQDKTLWVQVLETGCGFANISMKGLELQETSCHALEATKLEDVFTKVFENNENSSCCSPTSDVFSSISPLDSTFVTAYSDAKNSLAGILDQKDSLSKVRGYFTQALIWLILKSNSKKPLKHDVKKDVETGGEILQTVSTANMINLVDLQSDKDVTMTRKKSARSNALSFRSNSLDSFMSILSTDNEGNNGKSNKTKTQSPVKQIVRTVDQLDKDNWSVASILTDSGFGLPARDLNVKKTNGSKGKSISTINTYILSSDWLDPPVQKSDWSNTKIKPPNQWVEYCIEKFFPKLLNENVKKELIDISCICDLILNVEGVPGKDPDLLTPQHLDKVFSGEIPWSPSADWLSGKSLLHQFSLKAFRHAIKLVYDEISLGEIEDNSELDEYLEEYEADWFIGIETDQSWQRGISNNIKHLFSMSYDKKDRNLHGRVLSKQLVPLHIASVNCAAVQGIWADLTFELIYATNDDEERYSIQAHQSLMRNLTIQAADPPLGYPIFSSKPIALRTYPF